MFIIQYVTFQLYIYIYINVIDLKEKKSRKNH